MMTLRAPYAAAIERFLDQQRELALTYVPEGMTRGEAPADYIVDRRRCLLGRGEDVFARAVAAVRGWAMFRQHWTSLHPAHDPPHVGQVVAATIRVGPTWWTNSCRVLHLIDEHNIEGRGPVRRVGFAYGTLPGHAERGEERFTVEMTEGGEVWYDLLAYSQPRHWVARVGYPLTRLLQRRFGAGSARAMQRAVIAADQNGAPR